MFTQQTAFKFETLALIALPNHSKSICSSRKEFALSRMRRDEISEEHLDSGFGSIETGSKLFSDSIESCCVIALLVIFNVPRKLALVLGLRGIFVC